MVYDTQTGRLRTLAGQELKVGRGRLIRRLIPNHALVPGCADVEDASAFEHFLQTHNLARLQGEGVNLKAAVLFGVGRMPEVHLNDVKITFGSCFNQKRTIFTNSVRQLYSQLNVTLALKSALDELMSFISRTRVRRRVFSHPLDTLVRLSLEISNGEVSGARLAVPDAKNYWIDDICTDSRIGAAIAAKADNGLMQFQILTQLFENFGKQFGGHSQI